ncbi:50S ribosomal protein L17 [Candidatus Babeliales bacterium]|nr:50S ribosomal protein L17 [Candidatus Babeliales bacterium]
MSSHQNGKRKLNMRDDHRRSVLRIQIASFITNGKLQSTKARVKAVQQMTEKLVTIARCGGDFNTIRRLKKELPFSPAAVSKLVKEVAPRYESRPGGYTRVYPMGRRVSDTALIARLEWV